MKLLLIVASYLLGSVPTGYLLVRLTSRKDVREHGSRSTGATNVLRVGGLGAALAVAVIDVLKGFLPVVWALDRTGEPGFGALCGLLAVVGHCFPIWIGFRGGKGVATSLGAYLALSPPAAALGLGLFIVAVGLTRYVSLGSIVGSLAVPAALAALGQPAPVLGVSLAVAALIVFQHRGNIGRLLKGTERKLGERTP